MNAVVPLDHLEEEGVRWAREVLQHSPSAIRCLKAAFNAETDGLAGLQELAGQATHLFYRTEEAVEGVMPSLRNAHPTSPRRASYLDPMLPFTLPGRFR